MIKKLVYDMKDGCTNPVTHIGVRGYIYCAGCSPQRQGFEHTRRMRSWELKILQSGKKLLRYNPITQRQDRSERDAKCS
jgi:hypothetical protein